MIENDKSKLNFRFDKSMQVNKGFDQTLDTPPPLDDCACTSKQLGHGTSRLNVPSSFQSQFALKFKMEETKVKTQSCYSSVVRKIQAPVILEDELGKAKSFRLCSISRPHMRGFHTSWFTFFIAFTAWFGIQPLIPTIRKELCLDKTTVAHSGTASISATIFVRIVVGPLCDKFGPRRVMSCLLILGGIPMAFAGLIQNGTGLIIVRLFIGILGGTFIPCQFWTSAMFNVKIVGTANALVGGWGNLGGGFTFILMPALFELMKKFGADEFLAWKIAVLIPALIVIGFGKCQTLVLLYLV